MKNYIPEKQLSELTSDHFLMKNRTLRQTTRKMTDEMKTLMKTTIQKTIVDKMNLGRNTVLLCYHRPGCPVENRLVKS